MINIIGFGECMQEREEKAKQLILKTVENSKGMTITDVSKKLNIHYTTASKYLAVLEAEKKITRRDIGMAKLFEVRR